MPVRSSTILASIRSAKKKMKNILICQNKFLTLYQEKKQSMNKRNNWEQLLHYANQELNPKGYGIRIRKTTDGYYDCDILKGKRRIETYAENYFEDELAELVTDAWHYVINNKIK